MKIIVTEITLADVRKVGTNYYFTDFDGLDI